MAKIGIIGIGNMGSAILKGLLHVYGKGDIIFTDVNEEKCEELMWEAMRNVPTRRSTSFWR